MLSWPRQPQKVTSCSAALTRSAYRAPDTSAALKGTDFGVVLPNAAARSTREVVTKAFELAGKPPKMNAMGRLIMRMGGIFIFGARETVEMMYEFEKPFVVDDSKFKRAFGDVSTPFEAGLEQTLAWYRQAT